ncbi:ornithine decarboxylase [Sinomonas sp. ASV322]|uniref:aminotransferase class I/II-fold pyridoxal phosphate-dependent enzyme n=1 Tax=Sinomonas sp. ASV322 TaxID=3041920 RepID=UPI0027DD8258|nr:ornithine decarboxylase [Sinomonas sp. ASV322]MDQ4504620.1 ornithine decarboxylase [Sinomonas sp. ASV322]
MSEFEAQAYNAWWQARFDVWSSLAESAERLARSTAAGRAPAGLAEEVAAHLDTLVPLERYWAYPGADGFLRIQDLFASGRIVEFARQTANVSRSLATDAYRSGERGGTSEASYDADAGIARSERGRTERPYFEVLVVGTMTPEEERGLREDLLRWRRADDEFIYDLVVVGSGEEAVVATLMNPTIQACVVQRRFAHASANDLSRLRQFVDPAVRSALADHSPEERAQILVEHIAKVRPELDLYLMTEIAVEKIAGSLSSHVRRVFHAREGSLELHLSILAGVGARYRTPFFDALKSYSRRPTGVFHALPISQGKSIVNSHWIRDMVDFYGLDIFLAETSATGGGLDSLLEPTGPLREAQRLASEAFGSGKTFFVTNGTSTANKIIAQAAVAPGDIVLVDRNCHQSHHYGLMLSGAQVSYLEAYPLNEYSMYGAVPVAEIKRRLLGLRAAGKLDRVKMVMLTNCTFDGIVYDVRRVMEECLAIKPDLMFLWDEAWFAFARFHPVLRTRTAMHAAAELAEALRTPEMRARFERQSATLADGDDETLLATRLVPDPDCARVRVYATQSTHKTLTSLRQGSMIHVYDQEFGGKVAESFHEAYMAHTSTSPNYQILASLDIGRRQASLEGYELVQKQLELAMRLRDAIDTHPLLSKYMHCLTTAELIPALHRPSGIDQPLRSGLRNMVTAWQQDEFVLDPSRVTVYIGQTGIDGATFKREQLMDRFAIQINKTSRNTILFMTNIGTTRSSVAYLIEVLVTIARDLEKRIEEMSPAEFDAHRRRVTALTNASAPLPDFSGFHSAFLTPSEPPTPEGDARKAFFGTYADGECAYLPAKDVEERLGRGEPVVSATFVTPYPPGFPVLVPGQLFSREILHFMSSLDTPEVHGYQPENGYRVYKDTATTLAGTAPASQPAAVLAPLEPAELAERPEPTREDRASRRRPASKQSSA